ncbi:MAG: gliding motility-associated C-terminal domain-containing protein [Deltaproteobacteria bacterium]|nr:gliding motility-associated C-terminal domain-containing protein [Deltaproteobacteria bacterium]
MSVNSLFAPAATTNANTVASSAANAAANTANSSNPNGSLVSATTFMQLMVQQLENQDPLNPQSSSASLAQLAQFDSLNQLNSVNSNLQALVAGENQATLGNAVNMVGKSVQANGNAFGFSSGATANLSYSLPSNASSVSMDIYNSSGNLVYNTNLGAQSAGSQSFTWDGTENSGQAAPSGNYTFSVGATGSGGAAIPPSTFTQATVTGLSTSSTGAVQLELSNGSTVPLSSVTNVN